MPLEGREIFHRRERVFFSVSPIASVRHICIRCMVSQFPKYNWIQKRNNTKYRSWSWLSRRYVRILIYLTWPIIIRLITHVHTALAVFTLEDEKIVRTDKSSDVQTGRTNFSTNKSSDIWPSGKTSFLPVETNKSTTVRHKFTSEGQISDDLSVQTICSSSSQCENGQLFCSWRSWRGKIGAGICLF